MYLLLLYISIMFHFAIMYLLLFLYKYDLNIFYEKNYAIFITTVCIPSGAFVRFLGVDLKNHSYVDLTAVEGNHLNGSDSVECHTDLKTCCRASQGVNRGDWFLPSGKRLNFTDDGGDIFEARRAQQVNLYRRNNDKTSGIYRCTIETNAVHSEDTSDTTIRETVYVGLYDTGG